MSGPAGAAGDAMLAIGARLLRARRIAGPDERGGPTLLFLHEGLGCIEMWRDFPERLCRAAGLAGLMYDRTGYGRSSAWPVDPGTGYMQVEADEVLPELIRSGSIDDLVLVGHSDGGTIALDYAATHRRGLRAVATIGAHAINEAVSVESIRRARDAFAHGDLRDRLARYHGDNVDGAFRLWSDAWLTPGFEPMDAGTRLPQVEVPVLALQGEDDEYGTTRQLDLIADLVSGPCETAVVPACGHSPHLQRTDDVVSMIVRFLERV